MAAASQVTSARQLAEIRASLQARMDRLSVSLSPRSPASSRHDGDGCGSPHRTCRTPAAISTTLFPALSSSPTHHLPQLPPSWQQQSPAVSGIRAATTLPSGTIDSSLALRSSSTAFPQSGAGGGGNPLSSIEPVVPSPDSSWFLRKQEVDELSWWRTRCAELSVENAALRERSVQLEDQLDGVVELSLLAVEVAMELLLKKA